MAEKHDEFSERGIRYLFYLQRNKRDPKNTVARLAKQATLLLVHLNNKYALDGRDPNSYAGILWCFGKHDRPWFEREIFGTLRYMTSRSMAKKFRAKDYIEMMSDGLQERQGVLWP